MFCGLDIGGTKVLGLAVSPEDPVTPVATRRTATINDGDALIASMVEVINGLEADCGTTFSAVGVGVAGLVESTGMLRYSPNIDVVLDLDVRRRLREELRRPVVVDNEATAAAWAESHYGAARGARHVALVALGTGVGTGFVLDGRLYRGWNGFAGESGHMTIELSGPEHVTGASGPWEYYASGTGLGRLARQAAERGDFESATAAAGSVRAIRGEHVHDLVAAGEPDALAVLDEFCYYTAIGVANLVHVLDPEMVVIAGGLVEIGEPLVRGVETWTHRLVLGGSQRRRVQIVPAQLGSNASALGAALLAAENQY
ncbi:MAG: ROK family protein [Acidimicrobiaceae bacterium]|nr:ROK family protein [Acidimicrobiaceae bacterium]MCY4176364.1 ROK family protein [Acidimicrobiaceae bacterium]MCY4279104.1 ROK family protein [Acidimicrobiaceae bacterium]MCY4294603.1 ROK family protein [Acidimicrobiaceae bacterium]